MRTTVVFHSADWDGRFCEAIARKFLPDAKLIGWDYGDAKIPFPEGTVCVLDLSPDCLDWGEDGEQVDLARVIWIDHHKSAIDKFPKDLPGYRIDGVAACRLAWQFFSNYFLPAEDGIGGIRPTKEHFMNRNVPEPLAVRLAGEYDVWDHRDNDADVAFQFGLDSNDGLDFRLLLGTEEICQRATMQIVNDGYAAMRCYAKRDADVMRSRSFYANFEGLTFLCLNTARCNSNTFAAIDLAPETQHDALLAFYWTGKDFSVSMYHANHRKDIDLSEIAVRHGGGGHRGACGFRIKSLPFVGC